MVASFLDFCTVCTGELLPFFLYFFSDIKENIHTNKPVYKYIKKQKNTTLTLYRWGIISVEFC